MLLTVYVHLLRLTGQLYAKKFCQHNINTYSNKCGVDYEYFMA